MRSTDDVNDVNDGAGTVRPAVLLGHLGYGLRASKAVVAVLPDGRAPRRVELLTADASVVRRLTAGPVQAVPGWRCGPFARVELPEDLEPGRYAVRVVGGGGRPTVSDPFEVAEDRLQRATMSDVLAYFKAMRSSGEIDRKDRHAALWGDDTGREVDARGGWLDASGDTSKFLSHLTYTRTMSPQQMPLCAWAMMAARDAITEHHPALVRSLGARLRDEALWGADFLVRFRAPEGYFYTGVFDALTKELDERVVSAPLAECVRTDRYQAAYRQGGGLAIAALARAAALDDHGDFTGPDYLSAAVQGFVHLEAHNLEYLDDGTESIVDDYTALLAATELVAAGAGGEDGAPGTGAREAARRRVRSLLSRYVRPADGPGWFTGDAEGRPFFHAAEAGLPVLALTRFATVLPGSPEAGPARALALEAMLDTVRRTHAVPNPFGYPRQRVRPADASAKDAFFFPHANETGYWWQGENATIASLAAAASACAALDDAGEDDRARLGAFADDQLAWITGRNPFDASMVQGRGRNNVDYTSDFPNIPGGIVNGITSGWSDEEDIAFLPPDAPPGDVWRWAEQWIPHTGWFLLAVASAR
ncbi:glycoside hydrolase family 9 protein [Streptomyces sp. RKAG293]|uniref:glycoside hydrolase family 9 protein n=1 Tax=Streptomyces sp. RKAG293 TaxID=2893403 RepID=UPI0020332AD1|nr:glycoside hydrolase family 9 protein [Streptomyces sp. RKAG293]MCM2423582.1 glycoside hydrolase family 9 protein [Streptomyces sp. RKAG293]